MARPTTAALRAEITRLQEQAEIAERLEHAEGDLSAAQADLAATQQQLATIKTSVLAEQARLREVEQQQADARKVLVELGAEREAVQKELQRFARLADEGTKRFRLDLQGLVSEPELTEEELKNA